LGHVVLRGTRRRGTLVLAIIVIALAAFAVPQALALPAAGAAVPVSEPAPTPPATCGSGAMPETDIQGRVPTADYDNGRSAQGYRCNTEQVGHAGSSGGFRVYRYVDPAGHECAYYDTTLLVGVSLLFEGDAGVAVLDMSDPSHPVRTAMLRTAAMLSPHE